MFKLVRFHFRTNRQTWLLLMHHVAGMVVGWFSLHERLIFQSVSKNTSLQLEEELEHEVWDSLESLSVESDTANHNTWKDLLDLSRTVTSVPEFKRIWKTKNWVVRDSIAITHWTSCFGATHVLASGVLFSHY